MALRATLFSAMKNEGPFVLEWVAFHRLLGFDKIVVFTNDCTDGTAELLDALAEIGWVDHYDNTSNDGSAPQKRAAARAFRLPALKDAEWLIWLDADEFLNIHAKAGTLADLTQAVGKATGICINWRIFGSNGLPSWDGGLATQSFTRASRKGFNLNRQMKTLFRPGPDITGLYLHKPEVSPSFVGNGGYFVSAANQRLPVEFYYARRNHGDPLHELPPEFVSHKLAQINHYAVRSFDSYVIKRHRGNGWKSDLETAREQRYRYRTSFWEKHDRNEAEDLSIARHHVALQEMIAGALAIEKMRDAHHACLTKFRAETLRLDAEIKVLWQDVASGRGEV